MSEFDKNYESKLKEKGILKFWEKEKIFKFNEDSKKPIFSIDTPPPTISGKMHIGHAFSYAQTDFIARYKRMRGFEVFYPFGTDDNGLATEKLVQKQRNVNLRKVSREDAIKITMDFLEEQRPLFIQDFKNIGLSCDFNLNYSTISLSSQKISQKTFLDLFKRGLIEQREGPVPWDRVFQTPIAQAELEDKKLKSTLNYIKAKIVKSENTYLIYATTRPELLYGCVGMNIEEDGEYVKLKVGDEYWISGSATYAEKFQDFEYEIVEKLKGLDLIGEKAIIPLSNAQIDITHDISVKADYGTGIVYYCTYGGVDCIEWMARHPHINPIKALDKKGTLTDINGKYTGLIASTEGRLKILKDLDREGFLIKKEKIEHIVNIGERSGVEVEYIVAKQWYVKYLDRKEYFWEMAQKFDWKPQFMKHRLENWIEGLNWDWGFSRQRHFGVPIPIWYCVKCFKVYLPKEEDLPVNPISDKCPVKKCECGSIEFSGESDVFDTWFTSASTPYLAINLLENENTKEKLFPMDLRPQAHDIINFWLFYTMAKTNLLKGKNPFKIVAVSGFVLDSKGEKMSKSKGNIISPQEVVEKYSNDALRFAAASTKLGSDIPYQEKEVRTGMKVANKIFNACKFGKNLLEDFKKSGKEFEISELKSIDKWILAKLYDVTEKANKQFEEFDSSGAKSGWELFFMRDIADNYLEIVKQRLWNPKEFGKDETKKAQRGFYFAIYGAVRGLAPFMPYVTEEVYLKFFSKYENEKSIHLTQYPNNCKEEDVSELIELGDSFVEIVTNVRKFKAENQLSMKCELSTIIVVCNNKLKEFIQDSIEDLKSVTSAKKIKFESGEFNVKIKK